jgi:hypothetical protein
VEKAGLSSLNEGAKVRFDEQKIGAKPPPKI